VARAMESQFDFFDVRSLSHLCQIYRLVTASSIDLNVVKGSEFFFLLLFLGTQLPSRMPLPIAAEIDARLVLGNERPNCPELCAIVHPAVVVTPCRL
jgi:hypothetical protein